MTKPASRAPCPTEAGASQRAADLVGHLLGGASQADRADDLLLVDDGSCRVEVVVTVGVAVSDLGVLGRPASAASGSRAGRRWRSFADW